jgi:serine/threonine protein kinase/Tfp pilus assembly protein PilF
MLDASVNYLKTVCQVGSGDGNLLADAAGNASVQLFNDIHRTDPAAAERLSRAVTSFPRIGDEFLGFHLVAVLGRGAFGQVYLAEQGALANRRVALKVSADIFGESQTLAQLQHTNIVPIYSLHSSPPFQAVCMPYFGSTTLADVLHHLEDGKSLPNSGKLFVSTVNECKVATRRSLDASSIGSLGQPVQEVEAIILPPRRPPETNAGVTLNTYERMSYAESVLSMFVCLADALTHAHERGILHRDLKPANILLTDDGQPMLVDFNLSEDTKLRGSVAAASIGGTLPYMAPEHLKAFRAGSYELDGRSDVYSLGVILYELLTGRAPYPRYRQSSVSTIQKMLDDRSKAAPSLCRYNPEVSRAVESIVQHCLQADPEKRYQSARALREDLERQLKSQALKYAPERSLRERFQKWRRRHPRLASSTTIAGVAAVLVMSLGASILFLKGRLARFEAAETFAQFEHDVKTAEVKLLVRQIGRDDLAEGVERCNALLGSYQILSNPKWREEPHVRNLLAADQKRLDEDVVEVLFLLAKAKSLQVADAPPSASRTEQLTAALQLNELASTAFAQNQQARTLLDQRADLTRLLGRQQEAEETATQAKKTPAASVKDLYLVGHHLTIEGKFREALEPLKQATLEDPQNFAAWFVRGNCHSELLQDAQAIASYNSCVVLRPDYHWSWFNRGMAHLRLREFRDAFDDFDRVLRLKPDMSEALIRRAEANEGLRKYQEAIEDLSKALQGDKPTARIYFLLFQARLLAGDKDGAQRDFDRGLRTEPSDANSWIARGLAKQNTDVAGALADFEQALKLQPRSFDGLQNKGAALERLGKDALALEVMEKTVALYPDSPLALHGRGVLLARKNNREAAHRDAKAALLVDPSPTTQYQVACIYALTSKQNPGDRVQALHFLSSALVGGYGLQFVDTDTDLDSLRPLPEFKQAVAAAKFLHKK